MTTAPAVTPAATTDVRLTRASRGRATRMMLAGGVVAAPLFVSSTLTQATARDGFDLRRHAVSLLSNGDLGWVQTATFALTGVAVGAGALGLRRVLGRAPGGTWGPRLLLAYGVSFVAAAVFPADPSHGFPVGTAQGPATSMTAVGAGHMASGMIGFLVAIAGCAIVARAQFRTGESLRGLVSAATAAGFLAAVVGIMSGSGSASPAVTLGFWVAIAGSLLWLAATCRWAARTHLF